MERLLSGVREISLLDSELKAEETAIVDVGELTRQVASGYQFRKDRNIHFELVCPARSLTVRASADRLTEVLENVLDNAVSFSPDGGRVRLDLSAHDGKAVATIRDDGPGIPPQHLGRIFDRFFTYRHGAQQVDGEHTGLGLAIVKTIVEGYGGSITATNHSGGGAEFEIRLPLS